MYTNIGKKVMTLAKVMGWILLIGGAIAWLAFLGDGYSGNDIIGWISLVSGVVSFSMTWPLYAFGQLVDDTRALREKIAGLPSENQ